MISLGNKMKKFSQITKNYAESILTNLETTNKDDIILEIAKDLKFNNFFKLLMEELVVTASKKNKLINSFTILKFVSRESSLRLYPEFIQQIKPEEVPGKECEEIFNNITLFKGSLLKMLENMGLTKSKAHLIKSLILNDTEINANLIYSESEIKSFDQDEFEQILKEEITKKYKNNRIIINHKLKH